MEDKDFEDRIRNTIKSAYRAGFEAAVAFMQHGLDQSNEVLKNLGEQQVH